MFIIGGIRNFCRDTKIRQFGLPGMMNENISSLDIPMYLFPFMHIIQGGENMFHNAGNLILTSINKF